MMNNNEDIGPKITVRHKAYPYYALKPWFMPYMSQYKWNRMVHHDKLRGHTARGFPLQSYTNPPCQVVDNETPLEDLQPGPKIIESCYAKTGWQHDFLGELLTP